MSVFSLFVDLKANTADFVSGMSSASYAAKKAGREIQDSFSGLGDIAQKALAPLGEVGRTIGGSLASVAEAAGSAGSKLANLSSLGAAGAIAGIGASAIAAAAALAEFGIKGSEVVENIERISEKTGISVAQLQVFGAAGQSVGVSLDDVVTGMRKFDQVLTGTGRGSGALQATLKSLGATAKDNEGALLQLADAFKNMEDGPRKDAIAVELLGRSGLNLIPILDKGRDGIEAFQSIVSEFGPTITSRAIRATEDWKTSTLELSEAWQRTEVDLEKALLPLFSWMTDKIAFSISWWDKLGESIAHVAEAAAHAMPTPSEFQGTPGLSSPDPLAALGQHGNNQGTLASSIASAQAAAAMAEVDKRKASYKDLYDLLAAGGAKQLELQKQQENLAEAVALQDYKQAYAIETKIKALQAEIALEKQKPTGARVQGLDGLDDLIAKLGTQSAAEISLAGSIQQSVAAMTLARAAGEADVKISEEQAKAADRVRLLNEQIAQAMKEGHPEKVPAFKAEIAAVDAYVQKLQDSVPQIESAFERIAALKFTTGKAEGLEQETRDLDLQIASMKELSAAYAQGGAAIAAAQIDSQLQKDKLAVADIAEEYALLSARLPENAEAFVSWAQALAAIAAQLGGAQNSLEAHRGQLSEKQVGGIQDQIDKQTQALRGEAAAYQIVAAAAFSSAAAQREAAARAEVVKFSAGNAGATEGQKNQVYDNAIAKLQEQYNLTILQEAARADLLHSYDDEKEKLGAVYEVLVANGRSTVAVNAQIYEAQQKILEQWDQAVQKDPWASIGDKFRAFANEIELQGQNLGPKVFASMSKSVNDLSTQLASFVVTGKANFKQLFDSLAESIVKSQIQSVFGGIAKSLAGQPPQGATSPGAPGGTPGTFPGPLSFLSTLFGNSSAQSGQGQGSAGGLGGILTKLGLGGGSTSTGAPNGSQGNPFYTVAVNSSGSQVFGSSGIFSGLFGGGGSDSSGGALSLSDVLGFGGNGASDSAASGGLSGALGGLASIGSLFGGFLAGGGDVTPGKAYIVGEKHPEFFIPRQAGHVAPSLKMQQGHTIVNNISFPGVTDHDSFKRSQGQIMAAFQRQSQIALSRHG